MDERVVLPDKYWKKVDKLIQPPCWIWTGSKNPKGYGTMNPYGGMPTQMAHRLAYLSFKGPIQKGLTIDHLCRVRHCVNPDHLEAVTNRENGLRSPTRYRLLTHCKQGHEFTEANTVWTKGHWGYPRRRCLTCMRKAVREYCRRTSGYYERHPELRIETPPP